MEPTVPFSYEQVVGAIDYFCRIVPRSLPGLCSCFYHADDEEAEEAYTIVPRYLRALGASRPRYDPYYWTPWFPDGANQRLMMLAFMLTWLEENEK